MRTDSRTAPTAPVTPVGWGRAVLCTIRGRGTPWTKGATRPHPTGVTGAVAVDRAVRAHRSWAGVTGRGVVPREGQRFHRCVARYRCVARDRCVVRHGDPHGSATDRLPGTVPAELPERNQPLLRRPALTSD